MNKRYEALYVTPGLCDGIYDNKTNEYLDDETIVDLLNNKDYDSIWEERFIKENEKVKKLRKTLITHPKIRFADKMIELINFATNEDKIELKTNTWERKE